MSVYSSLSKAGPYAADGHQLVFPYGFYALDESHVAVFVGTERVRSGISVTVGKTGGNVVFDVPPPAGKQITILRDVPATQEVDLQNNTAFYPEVIEQAMDKLTMLVQQVSETLGTVVGEINANNGVGGNGGIIISGGITSNGSVLTVSPYQFAVIDSSTYNAAGNLLSKQVSVVHGRSTNATSCGTLNGVKYARTDIPLADGVSTYYIYAVGGTCYALRHEFHSDIIPTLLLATVTFASDGRPVIAQESWVDNPVVPVWSGICGASTINAGLSYGDHVLHFSYSITATVLRDSEKLTMTGETIPVTEAGSVGHLVAYVGKLLIAPGETPDAGLRFVTSQSGGPNVDAEWYQPLLSYTLEEDGASQSFRIISRLENPYIFTFTTLPLNADEVIA